MRGSISVKLQKLERTMQFYFKYLLVVLLTVPSGIRAGATGPTGTTGATGATGGTGTTGADQCWQPGVYTVKPATGATGVTRGTPPELVRGYVGFRRVQLAGPNPGQFAGVGGGISHIQVYRQFQTINFGSFNQNILYLSIDLSIVVVPSLVLVC